MRTALFSFILLAMLGTLMGFHLHLLRTGAEECDAYQKMLLERLKEQEIGSEISVSLREELKEYLSGQRTECAAAEEVYAEAADKYLAVLLALLTGAGIGAGTKFVSDISRKDTENKL